MIKFPKTQRLKQALEQERIYKDWKNLHTIIQEKVDGANVGISFNEDEKLLLQSRGHYLCGGPRERQFDLLKKWAKENENTFFDLLEDKYLLFGEWMYAKHHIFYDALPHYFLAFDVYDKEVKRFLSLSRCEEVLKGFVNFVPVLWSGKFSKANFSDHIGRSKFQTKDWKEKLVEISSEKELQHTDPSNLMEGIYVRVEDEDWVVDRMKYPREQFLKVRVDDSHWMTRPIVPNQLK